ncbi:MAG: helix-turn-helix domain-containing protein [Candidatus Woesearchaeota archaeon]
METEVLEKIGLSRAEIKVYLALVELGVTTTGPLSKRAGVPTSNIYPILKGLVSKGLVAYTIKANKKYFRAEDPERLKEFIQEQKKVIESQEQKLTGLITELKTKQAKIEKKQESFTYEGIKGIKTALEFVLKVLKEGDTFYVIDASRISNEKLMGYFNDFHKRRAKRKINYRIIYGIESLEFARERKTFSLTEVRILPKDIKIPSVFWILKDYVVIAIFSEEPVALMIKSPEITTGFLAHFNLLWDIAQPL